MPIHCCSFLDCFLYVCLLLLFVAFGLQKSGPFPEATTFCCLLFSGFVVCRLLFVASLFVVVGAGRAGTNNKQTAVF